MQLFTPDGYRHVLDAAISSGYRFLSFGDPERFEPGRTCLLRHDVDADLGAARALAAIEAERGVRATYFLMLRSPLYNLFGRANQRLVEGILADGHWLGLHFDEEFAFQQHGEMDNARLEELIRTECGMIRAGFGVTVDSVSFHQPGQRVLSGQVRLRDYVNTYDREQLQGYHYVSDSNMLWKAETPVELLTQATYEKLHLLLHPMWWTDDTATDTQGKWDAAILANFRRSQVQLLETERAYGGPREFRLMREGDHA